MPPLPRDATDGARGKQSRVVRRRTHRRRPVRCGEGGGESGNRSKSAIESAGRVVKGGKRAAMGEAVERVLR